VRRSFRAVEFAALRDDVRADNSDGVVIKRAKGQSECSRRKGVLCRAGAIALPHNSDPAWRILDDMAATMDICRSLVRLTNMRTLDISGECVGEFLGHRASPNG